VCVSQSIGVYRHYYIIGRVGNCVSLYEGLLMGCCILAPWLVVLSPPMLTPLSLLDTRTSGSGFLYPPLGWFGGTDCWDCDDCDRPVPPEGSGITCPLANVRKYRECRLVLCCVNFSSRLRRRWLKYSRTAKTTKKAMQEIPNASIPCAALWSAVTCMATVPVVEHPKRLLDSSVNVKRTSGV
jgi:hypothetical protein